MSDERHVHDQIQRMHMHCPRLRLDFACLNVESLAGYESVYTRKVLQSATSVICLSFFSVL